MYSYIPVYERNMLRVWITNYFCVPGYYRQAPLDVVNANPDAAPAFLTNACFEHI